jgi:hypothetical protein
MIELWIDIAGYEGKYQVSDQGRVRHIRANRILKQNNSNGYLAVYLYPAAPPHKKGMGRHLKRKLFVHRLVALAFCPNPDSVNIVNHIDRNPKNNCSTNLEWVTASGNTQHWMAHDRAAAEADGMPF